MDFYKMAAKTKLGAKKKDRSGTGYRAAAGGAIGGAFGAGAGAAGGAAMMGLDALDAATRNPRPKGLTPSHAKAMMRDAAKRGAVRGGLAGAGLGALGLATLKLRKVKSKKKTAEERRSKVRRALGAVGGTAAGALGAGALGATLGHYGGRRLMRSRGAVEALKGGTKAEKEALKNMVSGITGIVGGSHGAAAGAGAGAVYGSRRRGKTKKASYADMAAKMGGKAIDWASRVGGRSAMQARDVAKATAKGARAEAGGRHASAAAWRRAAGRKSGMTPKNYAGRSGDAKILKARQQAAAGAALLGTGAIAGRASK